MTPGDIARKALRGAIALGARQAFTQGFNALGTILLARLLSPAEFGLFAILTFALSFLTSFGGAGLAANLIRQPGEPAEEDYRVVFTVQEMAVAAVALIFYAAASAIAGLYHLPPNDAWLFRLVALAFVITSFMVVPQVRLERHLHFDKLAAVEVAQAFFYNATAVFLAWRGWGALSFALALALRSAVGALLVNRFSPWRPALRWDWPRAKGHLAFGLPYQGIAAVSLVKDSINPVLVGLLLGVKDVGYINWAATVATYPVVALFVFQRIYLPVFSRLQTTPALARYVEKTLVVTNALVAPLAVLTLVFIRPITRLIFGDKWLAALPLFHVLWIANLSVATSTPLLGLLNALGHSRTALTFAVIWMIGTWALGVPLIWAVGAIGFAWANLAVQTTDLLFFRTAQAKVPFRILPAALPVWLWAAFLGVILAAVQNLRPVTHVATLAAYFGAGLVVYALGLIARYRHELGQARLWWKTSAREPARHRGTGDRRWPAGNEEHAAAHGTTSHRVVRTPVGERVPPGDRQGTQAVNGCARAISVASVIWNEEHHLPDWMVHVQALIAAGDVNDVVVVDQSSTDDGPALLRAWASQLPEHVRITVLTHPHHGFCEMSRQASLDACRNPWALVLDADEWVTRDAALAALAQECEAACVAAIMFPRRNYVQDVAGGKLMDYFGDDPQVRLLRRASCRWPFVAHARPEVHGQTLVVNEERRILHHKWYFHTQRAKMERVVEATRRHHGDAEAERCRAFWETALAGFRQYLGVRER